ncbi:MAG: complex I subunit 1 family protein [Planctomycetota bacterium]|nr:complex I subunit 1 family protein [Planctomycetota bacterium]
MLSLAIESFVKIALLLGGLMTGAAYLVLLERRMAAWIQDRRGPNRVGMPLSLINSRWKDLRLFGLGQPLADGLKFIFKEEFTPAHVDRKLFVLAPIIILTTALTVFAVIPFGSVIPGSFASEKLLDTRQIELVVAPGIDVGMIFVFALSSVAVYGVILGGWASNNKYSFLGGLRSSAQLIAYELPLGLGLLGVVLAAGSLNLETIIREQALHGWYAFTQPLGCFVFLVAAFAESARLPFDLPECEQELIGGYHTEYSGIKLLLFLVAEFLHMVTMAFLIVILFLGGWHLPFEITGLHEAKSGELVPLLIDGWGSESVLLAWVQAAVRVLVLMAKIMAVVVFFMLVRWSWPRFRFDQLMALAWKVMLPLGMINFVVVAVIEQLRDSGLFGMGIPSWLPIPLAWFVGVVAWVSVSHLVSRIADNRPHRSLSSDTVDSAI